MPPDESRELIVKVDEILAILRRIEQRLPRPDHGYPGPMGPYARDWERTAEEDAAFRAWSSGSTSNP